MQWSGEHSVRRREDQAAHRRPSVILIFAANTRRKPVLVSPFPAAAVRNRGSLTLSCKVTVGRNRPARRQEQLVAVGIPPPRQRRLPRRADAGQERRRRVPRGLSARLLGFGPLWRPDGLGRQGAPGLPRPSHPRRAIRHRVRRRGVRARPTASSGTRLSPRTKARATIRRHTEKLRTAAGRPPRRTYGGEAFASGRRQAAKHDPANSVEKVQNLSAPKIESKGKISQRRCLTPSVTLHLNGVPDKSAAVACELVVITETGEL